MDNLPTGFWEESVHSYVWGLDGTTGKFLEGTWAEALPRSVGFADNLTYLKRALKKAYNARSLFIHEGARVIDYGSEFFGDAAGNQRSIPSLAQLRAALRTLILGELERRSSGGELPDLEFRFSD